MVWDKMTSRPQKGRFRQQSEYVIWGSNGPIPISPPVGCLPSVFRYANPQNRTHVTEKPLQLMRDLVKICVPGGRILDPFCGSGTTVLAAVQKGYEAVEIEVTDAINVFIQQSINVEGLPFLVTQDSKEALREQAAALLMAELGKGDASVRSEADWISEEEMLAEFGGNR